MAKQISWKTLLPHAADIVNSYNTQVTLRQLFYRLVSDGSLPNEFYKYKTLAHETAEARRERWFPSMVDETRTLSTLDEKGLIWKREIEGHFIGDTQFAIGSYTKYIELTHEGQRVAQTLTNENVKC